MRECRRLHVKGVVQGVGFRPFVYRLATRRSLTGSVRNDASGVTIEVEGELAKLDDFQTALEQDAPPLAIIQEISCQTLPSKDPQTGFKIISSRGQADRDTLVSPDTAICDDCLQEMLDPTNRRYRYPFINCTNCGPRFSIIRDIPYDRHQTTMAEFVMCPACQQEYDNPLSRRFHAQPNACPACGPQASLHTGKPPSHETITGDKAIRRAQSLLADGAILAIKGLGGYHLACDARNNRSVAHLRARKHREDKPFALMARDATTIEQFCAVGQAERTILMGYQRPIVLLPQRPGSTMAKAVAPNHRYLGFMLPYTPLHYLLLGDELSVLVMTSGNLSDEPIAYRDEDAFVQLGSIADAFLTHNREIHLRCDDSVVRSIDTTLPKFQARSSSERLFFIRRARGYTPQPITLPFEFSQPVLAVGGQLKNTFCLGKGRNAFMSHHIGDLENLETLQAFSESVEHFKNLFDIQPVLIAHDMHPEYLATKYAYLEQQKDPQSLELVAVQHHHAHVAGVMAEHGLSDPVIGVTLDGTGYGPDGRFWGGEFLFADLSTFTRAAHLAYMPLPGGEAAIRQPWRMAAAQLYQLFGDDYLTINIPFVQQIDRGAWRLLRQMVDKQINCPLTSSMGRLFDIVAALVGVRTEVNYEGQAAVELELVADDGCTDSYHLPWTGIQKPYIIETEPLIAAVLADLRQQIHVAEISAKFHNGVSHLITKMCVQLAAESNLKQVVLGGGVFQNHYLLRRTSQNLAERGFDVYLNSQVPTNDGGLALGQAAVAAAKLNSRRLPKKE